jgi:hypothetical protein
VSKIDFGVDGSQVEAMMGYIDGVSATIETDQYIGSVISYVNSRLGEEFGIAVDLAAKAMPESFMHVYEWGNKYQDYSTVGDPDNRLWRLTSVGRGTNRVMGYAFLPSNKPTPINPILQGRVKENLHVFTWKAPVMEYGLRVTVKRKPGTDFLVFTDNETDEIRVTKGPHSFTAGISPYGRQNQKGVFTAFFVGWWSTKAQNIFDTDIKKELERDLVSEGKMVAATRRFRTKQKSFTIGTSYAGQATFGAAKRQAQKDLKQVQKGYDSKTAQRRLRKYGI